MKRCYSHIRPETSVSKKEPSSTNRPTKRTQTPPETLLQHHKTKSLQSNQHFLRTGSTNKQQNLSVDSINALKLDRSEEPRAVSHTPKQRSKSTVSDRQPWKQILSKHEKKQDLLAKFDPLRTLHFLAKELQTHMQAQAPDDVNIQEIVNAMRLTLKRIPPEVASTVQLNRIDALLKSDENLSKHSLKTNKDKSKSEHSFSEIQKLIQDSTTKMEASCKHLEEMCGHLREDKSVLEGTLQSEKLNSKRLQKRVDELEIDNKMLSHNLSKRDKELEELKTKLTNLELKFEEKLSTGTDIQLAVADLKKAKLQAEKENQKLEHQLRLGAIEKEKYLAILAVRDRQIYEIRSEMTQLQQSVNEQLVELHNYAAASIPGDLSSDGKNAQENKEDKTISSIWLSGHKKKSDESLQGSEDSDEENRAKEVKNQT